MKNLLKYTLVTTTLFLMACGNALVEQKEKVVSAAIAPTSTPSQKEIAKQPIAEEIEEVDVVEVKKIEKEVPKPDATKTVTHPKTKKTAKVVEVVDATSKVIKSEPVTKTATKATTKITEEKVVQKEEVKQTPSTSETVEKEKVEFPKKVAPKQEIVEKPTPPPFSHDAWNTLAQKHISSTGKVNYKGFKADINAFDAYLKSLADNPVQNSWSRAKKMAYWINAYNAFTIKLIVDNYPVESITNLEGGKPWDKKWIKLGGKTYSLNNIEHDILRPTYKDARIHFAVNCAAKSCPPVWNKAWTEKNLNGQLERSAKSFINNTKYNSVGGSEANISKIFEWYAEDFGDNIITYLNKYANTKVAAGTAVKYKEYNWALNE